MQLLSLLGWFSTSRLSWSGLALEVEVHEESQEGEHVPEEDRGKRRWVVSSGSIDHVVGGLSKHQTELEHLSLSQVLLVHNIVAKGSKEVIGVHQNVNKAVQASREVTVSSRSVVDHTPPNAKDRKVVIDVQERNLVEVLLEQHDPGVNKFQDL